MAPRPFSSGAPKCARCGKSVYAAEQVIGPLSRPYHKPCLACVVCNKRLDSTLIVEHEGEPYCKNCHRAHLGQGKGGFALAVPLRPEKPAALKGQTTGASTSSSTGSGSGHGNVRPQYSGTRAVAAEEDRLAQEMSGISIAARKDNSAPVLRDSEENTPRSSWPTRPRVNLGTPTTVAQSIDDLVSSGYEVPVPYARGLAAGTTSSQRTSVPQSGITRAVFGGDGGANENGRVDQLVNQEERGADGAYSAQGNGFGQERAPYRGSDLDDDETPRHAVATSSDPASRVSTASSSSAPAPPVTPPAPQRETIGTVRLGADGLPPPTRKDPITLTREREKGLMGSGGAGTAKTYSPRTTPMTPPPKPRAGGASGSETGDASVRRAANDSEGEGYRYTPNSALSKMGLGSTVNAAAVGTPLCARCERPVCECRTRGVNV